MAKLRRAPVLLLMILALVLAACGGADEAGDGGADEGTGTGTEAEAEAGESGDAAEEEGGAAEEEAPATGNLEGDLITMLVGTSPGGGYDTYARLVAPFLAEELGADVTVENLSGAGGLLALNQLWTSEPDGTTLMMVNGPGTVGAALGDAEGIEFELGEFGAVGRIGGEPRILAVNASLPFETGTDLIGHADEFRFASTGPGGSTYNDAALAIELFDLAAGDIVSGFEGGSESRVSVIAGETQAIVSQADSLLPAIDDGDLHPLATWASEPIAELPDTPTLVELFPDGDEGAMAEAMVVVSDVGRVFLAPPGMPDDVLAEIRQALENVAADEDFLAEAEAQERPIDYRSGEETAELISSGLESPDVVRGILADAFAGG